MKNKKILSLIIISLLAIIILTPTFAMASGPIDNPNSFDPRGSGTSGTEAIKKANNIIGAVTTVGIIVSVVTLMVMGVKYMVGSVEEKAEYKKTMIPYLIGVVLLLAASSIVSVIAKMTEGAIK